MRMGMLYYTFAKPRAGAVGAATQFHSMGTLLRYIRHAAWMLSRQPTAGRLRPMRTLRSRNASRPLDEGQAARKITAHIIANGQRPAPATWRTGLVPLVSCSPTTKKIIEPCPEAVLEFVSDRVQDEIERALSTPKGILYRCRCTFGDGTR
jgi:hypothetical protein